MDFMSTALVTLKQPSGFWPSILNSFKGAMGTYILAVILIAVLVRIVFALVDIINKKVNMKNMDINAKMKPELDAVAKKYGNDKALLQQKQSEVYKKYQFSMMGSCLPMLLTMVLQFTVFLTLWNSLQSVSNYNISYQYENMKYLYANTIELEKNGGATLLETLNYNKDTDKLEIFIDETDEENPQLVLKVTKPEGYDYNSNGNTAQIAYKGVKSEGKLDNESIVNLFNQYVLPPAPAEEESDPQDPPAEAQEEAQFVVDTGYNQVFIDLAQTLAKDYFNQTKEGFMWIKNIYRPESPSNPMFTKAEITKYLSGYYTKEEAEIEKTNKYEEKIFDCVIGNNAQLKGIKSQHNGYYILTILAVLTSFLSIWLSNKLMRKKGQPAQGQNKLMYFITPLIMGIFTFMYTSLFAIYLIIGQVIQIALTPLTTLIVRKWQEAEDKKKKDKDVIEVDYRRKDV